MGTEVDKAASQPTDDDSWKLSNNDAKRSKFRSIYDFAPLATKPISCFLMNFYNNSFYLLKTKLEFVQGIFKVRRYISLLANFRRRFLNFQFKHIILHLQALLSTIL